MFNINISVVGNDVLAELVVDSYFFEPSKYEYAYYLYKDDEKIDTFLYSKDMKAKFNIKNMTGSFFVRAFIRDIERQNARGYNTEEISVNS